MTPAQVAESMGFYAQSSRARVDGELVDLQHTIEQDAQVAIITARKGESEFSDDALWLIRYGCRAPRQRRGHPASLARCAAGLRPAR